MFDGVFDVLMLSKAKSRRKSVAQLYEKLVDFIDDEGHTEGVAFLLADDVPTMAVYSHWRMSKERVTGGSHGTMAMFVNLRQVTGVERDGERTTVIHGIPPFVSRVSSSHAGSKVTGDDADPLSEYDMAVPMTDDEVRIEDVYDPSVFDIVSEWIRGDRDDNDSEGVRSDERIDGQTGDVDVKDIGAITYTRLENSYDFRESVKAWHLEHSGDAVRELRDRAENAEKLSYGGIVGAFFCVFLFLYGVRVASETGSSLVLVVALLVMVACGVVPIFLSVRGFGHTLEAERHLRERARVVEPGEATVICEEGSRYLLVRENPIRILDGRNTTDYVLVQLDDNMPDASYDEVTRIVAFSGNGMWRLSSVRYDADMEVIPSRDIPRMATIPSYEVSDTFVPSLREVIGLVERDELTDGESGSPNMTDNTHEDINKTTDICDMDS